MPKVLALGLTLLFQAEILLDTVHQTAAQLFLLPMHGQHRHPRSQPKDQMTAVTRLKPAPVFLQPTPESLTGHSRMNDTTHLLFKSPEVLQACACRSWRRTTSPRLTLAIRGVLRIVPKLRQHRVCTFVEGDQIGDRQLVGQIVLQTRLDGFNLERLFLRALSSGITFLRAR